MTLGVYRIISKAYYMNTLENWRHHVNKRSMSVELLKSSSDIVFLQAIFSFDNSCPLKYDDHQSDFKWLKINVSAGATLGIEF